MAPPLKNYGQKRNPPPKNPRKTLCPQNSEGKSKERRQRKEIKESPWGEDLTSFALLLQCNWKNKLVKKGPEKEY